MMRSVIQLAAWCGLTVGVFAMLFGGSFSGTQGLLGGDPGGSWATVGAALIGLAVCVNAVTQVRSTGR